MDNVVFFGVVVHWSDADGSAVMENDQFPQHAHKGCDKMSCRALRHDIQHGSIAGEYLLTLLCVVELYGRQLEAVQHAKAHHARHDGCDGRAHVHPHEDVPLFLQAGQNVDELGVGQRHDFFRRHVDGSVLWEQARHAHCVDVRCVAIGVIFAEYEERLANHHASQVHTIEGVCDFGCVVAAAGQPQVIADKLVQVAHHVGYHGCGLLRCTVLAVLLARIRQKPQHATVDPAVQQGPVVVFYFCRLATAPCHTLQDGFDAVVHFVLAWGLLTGSFKIPKRIASLFSKYFFQLTLQTHTLAYTDFM